jgi:mRNA-degrading endonuclease HigB of HigAB toxin-antitoxin module
MKSLLLVFLLATTVSFSAMADEDFCLNDQVVLTIGGGHYNVKIKEIFQDGSVSVEFRNGNSGTYQISDLSHYIRHLNGFQINEKLILTINGTHYNVTLKEIYRDRNVLVEFQNGNTGTYDISNLSKDLSYSNGLAIKEKAVLTVGGNHYNVIIRQIYSDRKVLVEFQNGNTGTYDINDLSYNLVTLDGFQVEDKVILTVGGTHYNVSIKQLYQDRNVLVEFQNGNSGTYNISNLSFALSRMNGLEQGDKVVLTIGGGHYNVTILQIYSDRNVSVEFQNGNTGVYNISNLSLSLTCTSTRECRQRR